MQHPQTGEAVAVALAAPTPERAQSTLPIHPATGRHRVGLKAARAFCEALFSTAEGPAPRDRMDWLMGEIDALWDRAGARSAGFYKLALILVNLLAPLMIGKLSPLWALPLEERVRALTRMEHSPLAAVVLASKAVICIIYYEHPDSAKEIGWTSRSMTGGRA